MIFNKSHEYELHSNTTLFQKFLKKNSQGLSFSFPEEDLTEDCYNDRSSCRNGNLEQEVISNVATKSLMIIKQLFCQVAYFLDRSLELWEFWGVWSSLPGQFEQMSFEGEL